MPDFYEDLFTFTDYRHFHRSLAPIRFFQSEIGKRYFTLLQQTENQYIGVIKCAGLKYDKIKTDKKPESRIKVVLTVNKV